MGRYREPDGYLYDERTGLYYSQVIAVDESGKQVQVVTWFNAESGEYSQFFYPIEETQSPEAEQSIQQVQEQEEAKILEAPPEPDIQITPGNSDESETEIPGLRQKVQNDRSKKTSKAGIPIFVGILILAAAIYFFKTQSEQEQNQITNAEENASQEIQINNQTNQNVEVKEETVTEESVNAENSEAVEAVEEIPDEPLQDLSAYPFPDYPTCNVMTQMADEDDQFVYAIRVDIGGWMFNSGIPSGHIIRFPKQGGEPELVVEAMDGIYSIAVMGDYIYYSINYGGEFTYCRRNKNGGEEEQLFNESYSLLQAYEGKIYLFFTDNGRQDIGIFDPETLDLTYCSTDYALTAATGIGGKQSVKAFSPFSIYNGCLYYGGWGDYTICYGKYNFENGQTQIFSTAEAYDIMDAGYADYVFSYIDNFGYSPYFINDSTYIDIWNQNLTTVLLQNRLLVSQYDYDTMYYIVDNTGSQREYYDIKAVLPVYAEDIFMSGVSENWIIYNDRAVQLSTDGIVNEISFASVY